MIASRAARRPARGATGAVMGAVAAVFLLLLAAVEARGQNQNCDGESHDCGCAAATICWCCDEDGNFGESCGNCVWWAWHEACCNWDVALEWCTDARTWDEYARDNGYDVGTAPEVESIFVRDAGTWGHVGWLTEVYPDGGFDTTEMNCGGPCDVNVEHREAGFADAFIYDPDPEPPPPDEPAPEPEPDPIAEEPRPEPPSEALDASADEPTDLALDWPDPPPSDGAADDTTGGTPGIEGGCGCLVR